MQIPSSRFARVILSGLVRYETPVATFAKHFIMKACRRECAPFCVNCRKTTTTTNIWPGGVFPLAPATFIPGSCWGSCCNYKEKPSLNIFFLTTTTPTTTQSKFGGGQARTALGPKVMVVAVVLVRWLRKMWRAPSESGPRPKAYAR